MSISTRSSTDSSAGMPGIPNGATVRFLVQHSPNIGSPTRRITMARSCSDLAPNLTTCQKRDSISSTGSGGGSIISPLPMTYRASRASHRGSDPEGNVGIPHTNSISSRGSTSSNFAREVQLIGQCKSCNKDYKCTCCGKCNHLMVFYQPASKPRVSNITFSTVTSATGLPTIAAEPSRPRSSSYWKPSSTDKENQPGPTSEPQSAGEPPQPGTTTACVHHSATSTTSIGAPHSLPLNHCAGTSSAYKSGSSTTTSAMGASTISAIPVVQNEQKKIATLGMPEPSPSTSANSLQSCCKSPFKSPSPSTNTVSFALPDDDMSSETSSASSIDSETVIQVPDGTVFDRAEMERDPTLRRISEWSFPIFHFSDKHKKTVLTRITYTIFREADLFKTFKVSPVKFFNFFHALECGYWEIPYHNRIHAADVLHGCYYLTCHPVRAFIGRPSTPESPFPSLDSAPLPIMDSMSDLELMALYTAAAMHDFDHPGRTNAFLVASEDRKAILYNDRSVLENHHAAESWRLLSQPGNNFIEHLDSAETKRFRYLVLEYILATDLKQHFDIIMQFNEKAPEMDLTNEADRVLVSQMLIKFADINSPAKPYSLHRQWTERICQEFYEQGDEEKRRNMPISPYMDRDDPAVAKLQDSFIAHIVNPLALALNEAGLLPVLPGLEEPELIINLKHNHQKWLLELEAEAGHDHDHDEDPEMLTPQLNGPVSIVEEDYASSEASTARAEMNGPTKIHLNNNIEELKAKKCAHEDQHQQNHAMTNGPNHVNGEDTIEKIE